MKTTRRILSISIILIMLISFTAVGFADESYKVNVNTVRVGGQNRYGTSQQAFKAIKGMNSSVSNLVIATGKNYADALAGAYFAHSKNAALLLTDKEDDYCVAAFIASRFYRNQVKVYILGGTSAISTNAETLIRYRATSVTRIAGSDRYDTNLKILNQTSGASSSDILVCSGKNFADALSASGVRLPILLVNDEITQAQANFLGGYKNRNIGGADRYETSYLVAEKFYGGSTKGVVLTSGKVFPDGLVAGPIAMRKGYPVLLVSNDSYNQANKFVSGNKIGNAVIMGGTGAVSSDTVNKAMEWYASSSSAAKPSSDLGAISTGLKNDPEKPVADVSARKRQIVKFALDNARRTVGQNCYQLVVRAYASAGINAEGDYYTRGAYAGNYLLNGVRTQAPMVQVGGAEPGDIILYRNGTHVAIYLGNKTAVHGGWYGWGTTVWSIYTSTNTLIGFWHTAV